MRLSSSTAIVTIGLACSSALYGQVADLVNRMPTDANAIIAINVDAIAKSPVAAREQWFEKRQDAEGANPLFLPAGTRRAVVATMIGPDQDVVYGVSVAELSTPISLPAIAAGDGGRTETVGDKPAATSAAGTYFVAVGASTLATIFPGNRQMAARVAGGAYKGPASAYLRQAVGDGAAALVMAVDTDGMIAADDALTLHDARPVKAIDDAKINPAAFAELLSTMKGITLRVAFDAEAMGTATIDFGTDASVLGTAVKPVVIEMLSRQGLNVVEFSNWKFAVAGKQVKGEGKLSAFTLKRLLSYADAPVPSMVQAAPTSPTTPATPAMAEGAAAGAAGEAQASLAYYRKIAAMLDGVKKAPSLGEQATWIRRDAKRISEMPVLNVDPELVAWGTTVSSQLGAAARRLAEGQRAVTTTSNSIGKPVAPTVYKSQDGPTYQDQSNAQYRGQMANYQREMRTATGIQFEASVRAAAEMLDGLAEGRTAIRQSMTAKYKVEF